MSQTDQAPGAAPALRPPKPYSKPTLTTFGAVDRLTKGSGAHAFDKDGHTRHA
jgi:hypothetical protein